MDLTGLLKESLRVLGGNKRVFLGKNLFTKGACYAGYRYTDASSWGFFYNCDYKMQGEIRMQVQCGEENIEIRLVEAGKTGLRRCRNTCCCMMERRNCL